MRFSSIASKAFLGCASAGDMTQTSTIGVASEAAQPVPVLALLGTAVKKRLADGFRCVGVADAKTTLKASDLYDCEKIFPVLADGFTILAKNYIFGNLNICLFYNSYFGEN